MRQRGVALITAIVVVAIATILAVRIGTRAAMDLRRTAGLVALDQGWHVALGAEAWAIEVLKDDIKNSQEFDHPGEAWAQPLPPLPIDGGEVRGALEDMQGRFNLNNLVTAERETDAENVARFADLLVQVGAQPRWASLMADWIDESPQANSPEGAEDGTYLAQNPPYRAANGLIATTTEMMALPGMTRDEFERIRPFVTALPPGTRINVCTAKPPVLAMLSKGGLDFSNEELLAANRRDGCYPLPEMFNEQFQSEVERDRVISKTTNWFRAVTAVRIGTSEFTLYSLINRNESDTAIRTVLRSTGTE